MANDEGDLNTVALSWPDRASVVQITDQASYDHAACLLADIVTLERRVVDHHRPIKESAFHAHRTAVAAERKMLEPLAHAKMTLKAELAKWEQAQERLRLEAQRQAAAEQRRQDEEARLSLAAEAEQNGASAETVAEILATPTLLPTPIVAPKFQRTAGIGTQQRWRAQVYDLRALCRAVADGVVTTEAVQADMAQLNAMARALKGTMSIPGVQAVPDNIITVKKSIDTGPVQSDGRV